MNSLSAGMVFQILFSCQEKYDLLLPFNTNNTKKPIIPLSFQGQIKASPFFIPIDWESLLG